MSVALIVIALLGAMALKNLLIALPAPPAAPIAGAFDANRAYARLRRILGDERPHPIDSAAGDRVRDRLIAELRAVGLSPRVTDDFTCNGRPRGRTIACGRVRNVVATIGPATGRHVLLVAHYDSTFVGPGAADPGIGVASLVEIAADLRGQRLARPVAFLFTDGEEMGLLGARAFLERDPLAAQVDTLVNLEARGVSGPAIMFETSQPEAPAIALFQAAATRPVANSLTTDLYHLIPNSTDVEVFQSCPWTILNFAITGNETRYHSAGDTLAALDRRSLQHMGEQVLALTRLAAAGTPPAATGRRLYSDFVGRQFVVLPFAPGLALLATLVLVFAMVSWRRRALDRPLIAAAAGMVGAAMLAWAGQFAIEFVRSGHYWRAWPVAATSAVYASAILAIMLSLRFIARDASAERLRAAFWLFFTLIGAALSLAAPGGAIFFLAPPLVMALGIAAARRWPGTERIGAVLAILLAYFSIGAILGLFEVLMNNGPHWMFAPLGALLLYPALIELRALIDGRRDMIAAAGVAFVAWTAVALTPAYSRDRQQIFAIDYAWDADARQGRWMVANDGAPIPAAMGGGWGQAQLPYLPRQRGLRRYWSTQAPALPVLPPTVTPVGVTREGNRRHLSLRIAANGAEIVTLIAPGAAVLRGAGPAGSIERFGAPGADDRWIIRCVGRSCDGALIDLIAENAAPIDLLVVGTRSGLPAVAAPLVAARPGTARPQYSTDSTIAYATIRL